MKNLFEAVEEQNKEQVIMNYVLENKLNDKNIVIPMIKQVLENKLDQFKKKDKDFENVNLNYQDCIIGPTKFEINQYELETIHINLWKFIEQIYDDITLYEDKIKNEKNTEQQKNEFSSFVKKYITNFERNYQIIGHALSHIKDYSDNGFRNNKHDKKWQKIFKEIVGTEPNLTNFVD